MTKAIVKSVAKKIAKLAFAIEEIKDDKMDEAVYELEGKIRELEGKRDNELDNLNTDGTMNETVYDRRSAKIDEKWNERIAKVQEEIDAIEEYKGYLDDTLQALISQAEELAGNAEVDFDPYE